MLFRLTILSLLLFSSDPLIAQTTHILKLKNKKNYSEKSQFFSDSTTTLVHEVCYNEPNTIDEEGCYILTLTLIDTSKARQLKKIDITKDTSIIKSVFDYRSVWDWADEKVTLTGVVNILALTEKTISVDMHIKITDNRRSRAYTYIGTRIFENQRN